MRVGTPLTVVLSIGILSIAGSIAAMLLATKATAMLVLGIGIVIMLGLALFNSRHDGAHHIAVVCMVTAGILGLVMLLANSDLLQHAVPICGDNVCTAQECAAQCVDCTAAQCVDNACQLGIERCDTSPDCPCSVGSVCAPSRPGADAYGCISRTCGDGWCDDPESSLECCRDCGCAEGYACANNICLFQPPRVGFQPHLYSRNASATTLAANPYLVDTAGVPHPIFGVILRGAVSTAKDVTVSFALPYVRQTYTLGTLMPDKELNATWYLQHEPLLLSITRDLDTTLNMTIAYRDLQGVEHTIRRTYPFTIYGRGTLDRYGELAFFVTPEDVPLDMTQPVAIWEALHERVTLVPEDTTVQFPAETLAYGTGDRTDVAILLASAFTRAGLEPGFVTTDKGLFIWLKTPDDFIVVDPERFSTTFTQALEQKPGSLRELQLVHRVWERQYIFPLSLDDRMIPGTHLYVTQQVAADCDRTSVTYTLRDTGKVPSDVCANSTLWVGDRAMASIARCMTLLPAVDTPFTHTYTPRNGCEKPTATLILTNRT